jgi:hypothetical protein
MIALHTVSSFQKNEIDVNKNEHFIGPGFSRHLEREDSISNHPSFSVISVLGSVD